MINEARKIDLMNQLCRHSNRSNRSQIVSLVNRFMEITRKEWIFMNEARQLDFQDADYENGRSKTPMLTIVPQRITENTKDSKAITNEYLNEKLIYFYNNGGPIMDL